MPILENLKKMADETIDPLPPTWGLVYHLLLANETDLVNTLGAAVAATGEASIFSYARNSFEPMYYSTIGFDRRLKECTGYHTKDTEADPEKLFAFIRECIDAGKGVYMAGPESGLCYGYEDAGTVEDRVVYGVSNWGPAFNGAYTWSKFAEHVESFRHSEGFSCVVRDDEAAANASPLSAVKMLARTVSNWQTDHPAANFGMKQEYYGLPAFRQFIEDVRDPDVRPEIEGAYLNCHSILFQFGGRYWVGQYLHALSTSFDGDMRTQLMAIADDYIRVYEGLKRFKEFNILDDKSEEQIQEAADWLDEAYHADERIVEGFELLKGRL